MVYFSVYQELDNHDEKLVWQESHRDDTQLRMKVRVFDKELFPIRIEWYGRISEDRDWRPMKLFRVAMKGAGWGPINSSRVARWWMMKRKVSAELRMVCLLCKKTQVEKRCKALM